MNMSRRDFVKLCAGSAAGLGVAEMFHPAVRDVLAATLTGERPPVFWVQGQGCTGCTVSLLNNIHPGIAEVLLKIISLDYQPTIMAAEGAQAFRYLLDKANEYAGRFIYIVEGSIYLDDLNDRLETNLDSEDYDSLGGFIIEHLDRLPELGDNVRTEDGIRLVVESLDKNRVETVHIYLPENFYDKEEKTED